MLDLSFIVHYMLLVPHARPLQRDDLVLRVLRRLSSHYQRVAPEGVAWWMNLDGNQFSKLTSVDQLKKFYV